MAGILLSFPDKFKQLLINLVTNTFKAVIEGEIISIDRIYLQIHSYVKLIPLQVTV